MPALSWRDEHCVAVVLAAEGYPEKPAHGRPILGLEKIDESDEIRIFHAGTTRVQGRLVSSGGRVLTVAAVGPSREMARERVYQTLDKITLEGGQWRSDIGSRSLQLSIGGQVR